MKIKFLTLSLLLISVIPAMSNNENDTIVKYKGKDIVISEKNNNSINIDVNTNNGKYNHKTKKYIFVDELKRKYVFFSSCFYPFKKEEKTFYPDIPSIFIGTNLLNSSTDIHARNGKSLEWGVTLCYLGIQLNKENTLGIASGIQFGIIHNHFLPQYKLNDIDGKAIIVPNNEKEACTSFLRYNYLKIPIILEYKNTLGSKSMFIGLGCSFEWRNDLVSKYRTGNTRHSVSRNINYNILGANVEGIIGFSNISIYAHYSLTKLLKDTYDTNPIGIGIGINL